MTDYILALDEGTSSARAVLFDQDVNEVASVQEAFSTTFPSPGWVEQDPLEVWRTQLDVLQKVVDTKLGSWNQVRAIGITNQRETTLIWDRKTGEPIAPAIVWQCRRTAGWCEQLKRSPMADTIQSTTGLVVDAYFSASKICWILEQVPDARQRAEAGELLFGTIDTWLIYCLTAGKTCVIDRTNASRTMLMDLRAGEWSQPLLDHFGIPNDLLPEIVPSIGTCGYTSGDIVGAEIPISGIAGDQQAALFGQGCTQAGEAKNTYGTGCFLLMHTGQEAPASKNQLLTTAAASLSPSESAYALEGSVFDAGTTMQWLRDGLKVLDDVTESEAIACLVEDTNGVWMVPAFTGLGAPHWEPNVRGSIVGLTRGTTRAHIVRAALESIALQTCDLVKAMEADSGTQLTELRVDGGAALNDFLMQFQADSLGIQINRPSYVETTVKGAALLAGTAIELYGDVSQTEDQTIFEPQWSQDERDSYLAEWRRIINHAVASVH